LVDVADSSGLVAAVASGETVGLGAAVSVFRSQATSNAVPAKMQMYFFIDLNPSATKCGVLNEECPIKESSQVFCILLVGPPVSRAGLKARTLRDIQHQEDDCLVRISDTRI
jgi:hypothetical protein